MLLSLSLHGQSSYNITSLYSYLHYNPIISIILLVINNVLYPYKCLPIQWQNVINAGVIDDDVYEISNIQVWFEHDFVVDLNSFVKKDLYKLFLLHYNSDDSYNRLVWCDLLSFDVPQARYFENCYSPMLRQKECDLLWKILQGKIPTGQYLFNCKFVQSPNCIYCANKNNVDDLMHIFFECDRLKPLFDCVYANIRKLLVDETIPLECYIIGLTRHRKKSVVYHHVNLANWMIAIAKVAIVQSRYNIFKGSGIHCALMLYKSKLKARLVTEFSYAMLTNQTDKFRRIWNCNNSLFTMKSNDLIFKF